MASAPALLFFCMIIISFSHVFTSRSCNGQNLNTIECIRGHQYSNNQYGMCVNKCTLAEVPEEMTCYGDYCWLPCMYRLFKKKGGDIRDECKCNDEKIKHSWWSRFLCFIGYKNPKYICDWIVNCFEKKSTCHRIKKMAMPFYDDYCIRNTLGLEVQGRHWLYEFVFCVQKSLLKFTDSTKCDEAEKEIKNLYAKCINETNFCTLLSPNDRETIFSQVIRPYIKDIKDDLNMTSILDCHLGSTDSVKLFRYHFMDPLTESITHQEMVKRFSNQLNFKDLNTLSWNRKIESKLMYFDVLVLSDDETAKKHLTTINKSMEEVFKKHPLLLRGDNGDKIQTRVHIVQHCSSTTCQETDYKNSVKFTKYVCDEKHFKELDQLAYVHENAQYDCCAGSEGGQCVALVKNQCKIPQTACWVPQRKVIENCNSIEKGTVVATFDFPSMTYGNRENPNDYSHTAVFISCNDSGEILAYGQACGHPVIIQNLNVMKDRLYEASTVEDHCRKSNWDFRKRYKKLAETKSIICDATKVSNLNDRAISQVHVTIEIRKSCDCPKKPGSREETLIGCLCNAPAATSWIPGKKIAGNCDAIPVGTVLATFKNGDTKDIYRPGGQNISGIMKSCTDDIVEIYTQKCSTDVIVLMEIKKTDSIWNSLHEVLCDDGEVNGVKVGGCKRKYSDSQCNVLP